MNETRVIIFSTVWPEPQSSAAGVRQMQWVNLFLSMGYRVTLVSPSKLKNENDWGVLDLPKQVDVLPLPMNRESVQEVLSGLNPEIVMFDRFILEEQFGPHVYTSCPHSLILMETQDLHFVRRARDEWKQKYLELESTTSEFYQTDTALRETSSILRVDYSFVVSSFEEKLLQDDFKIGPEKLKWIPFFYEKPIVVKESRRPFLQKENFCWIGNFRHEPNIDGLRWFRNEVWPLIKKQLPDAKLKVYGAYPPEEVMAWNNVKNGISVKGSAATLDEVFIEARVNIAPLRFGAGVKGKILEGFRYGVPTVTTKVGVEGLFRVGELKFPGIEANTTQDFADACVRLHQDEQEWKKCSLLSLEKMMENYAASSVVPDLKTLITKLLDQKKNKSLPDWISKILRFEGNQSRYYFAKWIEAKESKKPPESI